MKKTEAIKILIKYDLNFCDIDGNPIPSQDLVEAFDMAIQALEQEPKRGKWIYAKEQLEIVPVWECSCCRIRMPKKFKYCPNCGAIMESEE